MFDRRSVPPFCLGPEWSPWHVGGYVLGALVPMALAFVMALSTAIVSPSPAAAAENPEQDGPSIQYQEALSHASTEYTFAPGGPVDVPYRPRAGDTTQVDGAPPVALPAGIGSTTATPNQEVIPNGIVNMLRREVFGFLPYWELSTTLNYDALSTIAYFGIDLNTDGTLNKAGNGWNGWVGSSMTSIINDAHAHGTRVVITIESFAWDKSGQASQSAILGNPTTSLTAAQQIAAEVGRRGVDGVNLDFEPIASGQYSNFVTFTRLVRSELDKVHPGYELTFCATGAPGTYDLPNLLAEGAADAVFIMGYDLRGGTPPRTGSIAPLVSPYIRYDLTYVVNTFLSAVPPSKVILGLPWYGHAWSTGTTSVLNAPPADIPTYGAPATGITYASAIDLAATIGNGKNYDPGEQTAWTAYFGDYGGTQSTWRELYFDDAQSIAAKSDAVDGWNLRGEGIWALGYDNNHGGDGDLTAAIASKFLSGPIVSGTYHPLTPVRILDTRSGTLLTGAFLSGQGRSFPVAGANGVPAGALGVTGNLTITQATAAGYVQIGSSLSGTYSTINFGAGESRANGVTLSLGTDGNLSAIYASSTLSGSVQLIFDLTGYFTAGASGATYHSLTPARVLDTRANTGLSGPFHVDAPRTFQVAGRGGVPSNATAVTGNVTVTDVTNGGALYLGPNATASPTSSTINFSTGDTIANSVTLALGSGGTLSATYMSSAGNTTSLVFDVTGYFTADSSGATYHKLAPARLLDTRANNGLSGKFSAGVPRTFQVTGRGGVPSSATAVTGNLTVTDGTNGWAVYLGPVATATPPSSTINFGAGDVRANGVTVALGSGGTLSATYLSTSGSTTSLIFDVTGYFSADSSGTTYHSLTPVRILDTRVNNGLSGSFSAGVPRSFQVAGRGGVPSNATAVTGNLTVTDETRSGAIYLGPVATATPSSSTINFRVGDVRANGVTVALASDGSVSATYLASAGTTSLVFDASGYFTPDATGGTYHSLTPARVLDTRINVGLTGPFSATVPRTFQVTGLGGVPGTATAVTGNLTVTNVNTGGAVYLGPVATASPGSSTINFAPGDTIANGVTVPLGSGGTLSATYLAASGTISILFDVTGYFTPDMTGATYRSLTPTRILDTRVNNGLSGPFSAGTPRTFQVVGFGGVPTGATAVTGNLTVTDVTSGGAYYLGPVATANPSTSTINFSAGDVRANGVSVALGTGGVLSATYLASPGTTTSLVFDVGGYFAP